MMRENPHKKPKSTLIALPKVLLWWFMYSFGTSRKGQPDDPYDMPREISALLFAVFVAFTLVTLVFFPIGLAVVVIIMAIYDLMRSMVYAYYPAYYDEDEDNA